MQVNGDIYIYISGFNALRQLPLGCDIDWFPQIVRPSWNIYHPMMDLQQQKMHLHLMGAFVYSLVAYMIY